MDEMELRGRPLASLEKGRYRRVVGTSFYVRYLKELLKKSLFLRKIKEKRYVKQVMKKIGVIVLALTY